MSHRGREILTSELHFQGVAEMAGLVRRGEVSPVELTRAFLDRIELLNQDLNAFITVMGGQVVERARRAEEAVRAGKQVGILHGVPVAVKDIIYTKDVLTSAGSRVLSDHVPREDSTIVRRLEEAGALLLGKLNLSEFAIGGTVDHPYGTPRNPWNTGHTPGGSSSGSAVAVAAGLCAGALGSDTGGSVRGPSAFCGVVGLRPTYGRVTRHGVVPVSNSMDTVGPMTRTVEDCALMLQAIAGHDGRDPTSSSRPVPSYTESLRDGVRGLRVGVPIETLDFEGLHDEVRTSFEGAVEVLGELGASVDRISLPSTTVSGAAFIAVADVDAAAYHRRWLTTRGEDYDWSTRTRLESGLLTPASAYIRAQRIRALVRRELLDALSRFDVLLTPTGPVPAPAISASTGEPGGYYQGRLDLGRRRYTSPPPLAGLPALSVPCGFSADGLPIGMQIVGRPFDEGLLFRVGHAYEQATPWHTMRPPV